MTTAVEFEAARLARECAAARGIGVLTALATDPDIPARRRELYENVVSEYEVANRKCKAALGMSEC